jgi:MFS family permease
MGDRVGRKPAMVLSFACMGLAMIGLALTPAYASIGIAAPILVIAFRLLQGFALGGDVGPTTAYLIEVAPPERRGYYASLQIASQGAAILMAGIIGVVLGTHARAAGLARLGLAHRVPDRDDHRAVRARDPAAPARDTRQRRLRAALVARC